jgi:ABC-2 type transport system ATP-binding protein
MENEAIVVENVSKRFNLRHTRSLKETVVWLFKGRRGDLSSTFMALEGVDLTVSAGESVALLGYNGSGKSTLLKLISGVMSSDSGRVRTRGKVAGLIEVGAGFHPDLTGRENVYLNGVILGMTEQETTDRFDEIVAFSEIGKFIDTEVKFYSSGMFLRLAFRSPCIRSRTFSSLMRSSRSVTSLFRRSASLVCRSCARPAPPS